MKVAVINYGMGNLGSVSRAISEIGAHCMIAEHPGILADSNRIILPGVGSFCDAMAQLRKDGWVDAIHEQVMQWNKPLLGICLGMQLLATTGSEGGNTGGLNLISGQVVRLSSIGCDLRIPHIGWNEITLNYTNIPLFGGIPSGTDFYFVHSYTFLPDKSEHVLARTDYGIEVTAAVGTGCVFGTQFHPEKSSKAGFRVLKNFLEFSPC